MEMELTPSTCSIRPPMCPMPTPTPMACESCLVSGGQCGMLGNSASDRSSDLCTRSSWMAL